MQHVWLSGPNQNAIWCVGLRGLQFLYAYHFHSHQVKKEVLSLWDTFVTLHASVSQSAFLERESDHLHHRKDAQ